MTSMAGDAGNRRSTLEAEIMGYGPEVLPRLRRMAEQELAALLEEVDAINQRVPLANMAGQLVTLTRWHSKQPIPAFQVIPLLVFGLWVLAGEDEEKADFLIKKWPRLPQTARQCSCNGD